MLELPPGENSSRRARPEPSPKEARKAGLRCHHLTDQNSEFTMEIQVCCSNHDATFFVKAKKKQQVGMVVEALDSVATAGFRRRP